MSNEKGIQEQMLECLQMMQTHLGIIAKNPGLGVGTNQASEPGKGKPKAAPAKAEAAATAPAATAVPSIEDVRAVLTDVSENFGREAAIKLLKDNGYKNATTVPEKDRAAFIAICKA